MALQAVSPRHSTCLRSLPHTIALVVGWVSHQMELDQCASFEAKCSGYLDEGHLFDFLPHGATLITGGSVGPEGSLLAFLAVLTALLLLTLSTQPVPPAISSSQHH